MVALGACGGTVAGIFEDSLTAVLALDVYEGQRNPDWATRGAPLATVLCPFVTVGAPNRASTFRTPDGGRDQRRSSRSGGGFKLRDATSNLAAMINSAGPFGLGAAGEGMSH